LEQAAMDKAYDSNQVRDHLKEKEIEPVIPPRSNRTETIPFDKDSYKLRNKIERLFNKMKHFRRIATRYEKLGQTFLALIHLVVAFIIVR
jgi:transposase